MGTIIPARCGAHVTLQSSQRIKILNPSGHQVIDCWAFPLSDTPTWMSISQTRSKLMKLIPSVGDVLVDTHRNTVLKLVENTSSGVHDMLFPACDERRYTEAGVENHASCGDNLRRELAEWAKHAHENDPVTVGLLELEATIARWGWTPEPLNLFMSVPWSGNQGELRVRRPDCQRDDSVVLEAMVDCVVVMSACPNDLLDTNGGHPVDGAYEIN